MCCSHNSRVHNIQNILYQSKFSSHYWEWPLFKSDRFWCGYGTDGNIILAGDTNIHLDKQSILRLDYEKQLLDHRLNQYVNYYTRLTSETVSLIDHVISNIKDLETMVTHEMCADHQTVIGIWGKKERQTKKLKVMKESRERIHIDKTIENLQKINW